MFRLLAGERGNEHIPEILLVVANVAFLLKHPKFGADGGVGGGIRERLMDFSGACAAALIEDIHDLAFPAAESDVRLFRH